MQNNKPLHLKIIPLLCFLLLLFGWAQEKDGSKFE
jgi:hypothetical protein